MKPLLLLLLSISIASAESIQEQGRRVMDEALAALGGERFLAMKDRVETGRVYSFFRAELRGLSVARIYTQYLERPEGASADYLGLRERQSFGREEITAALFADGKGYEITFRGARPLPDDVVDRFQQSTINDIFYILRQRLDEKGLIFESRGWEIWQNQPVDVVNITDAENRVVTVYIHRSTRLPVRQVFHRRDPKTRLRIEEDVEFGKYRDVGDGVQWPFTVLRRRNGERVFQIFSETVAINQSLSDSLFTLPTDMKILERK